MQKITHTWREISIACCIRLIESMTHREYAKNYPTSQELSQVIM